jgi:hypothetical protein
MVAVAADFGLEDAALPAFAINDIDAIAGFILGWSRHQGRSRLP